MLSFYQQLVEVLQQKPLVLATIVKAQGSTPREVGAKMAVLENGQIIGTIGGGAGEAKVIQQARTVLTTGEKQLVEVDLTGATHRSTQGICGGTMQVWLERWQGNSALQLISTILNSLKSGRSEILVTPWQQEASPYLVNPVEQDPQYGEDAFHEVLLPPPTLLIVGGGHVAIPLATIASLVGFRVVIQDDRPDYAQISRFPTAVQVLAQSIEIAVSHCHSIPDLYAALVTRGYQHDLAALQVLLQRPTRYIGLIGSQKRVQQVYLALEKQGITKQQLDQIHGPIGLNIGALTPEEIAVSICAELVMVRRGGTGQPLSSCLPVLSKKG